jgi:hypothetical protein
LEEVLDLSSDRILNDDDMLCFITLHFLCCIQRKVTKQLHCFETAFSSPRTLLCHTVTTTHKFCHLLTLTKLNPCNCENTNQTGTVNVT